MHREPASVEPYDQTSRGISSKADCSGHYVLKLAKAGLVPHLVSSSGTYLYPLSAVATVKALKAAAIVRRGGWNKSRIAAAAG